MWGPYEDALRKQISKRPKAPGWALVLAASSGSSKDSWDPCVRDKQVPPPMTVGLNCWGLKRFRSQQVCRPSGTRCRAGGPNTSSHLSPPRSYHEWGRSSQLILQMLPAESGSPWDRVEVKGKAGPSSCSHPPPLQLQPPTPTPGVLRNNPATVRAGRRNPTQHETPVRTGGRAESHSHPHHLESWEEKVFAGRRRRESGSPCSGGRGQQEGMSGPDRSGQGRRQEGRPLS